MDSSTPFRERYGPRMLFVKHVATKIFLEDWLLKLLALVITLALWFGVTGLSTPTTTRLTGVPLTLRFASNTEVTNSPVNEVDIIISGDKRRINQINKNDLIISVDLTDVQAGDRVVQLTPENITLDLPTGVKLDEIQPNRIAIRLEPVDVIEVAVRAETEGTPPEGYEIYSQTITPARVSIRGPAGFLKSLSVISTEKIDLSDKTSDFVARQLPLNLENPKASPLEASVDVSFRIGERRVERLFLVQIGDDPTRKATVVLFGPRSLLLESHASDLMVAIEPNAGGEQVPRLILPEQLEGKVEIRKLSIP
ncbi:MAG: hypothetical protein KF685_00290 [Acidobacteria bacterium]|nr:hypothetical protein [Acidobacteriota bacterium]